MSPRYEVIETKVWKRDDGVLAMPYALAKTRKGVPWRKPSEEKRWKLVTYYTVRADTSGTRGTPSPYDSPWPTRSEAQAWVDAHANAHAMKKSHAQLNREIAEVLTKVKHPTALSHKDGTRNHLGKLLAAIARSEPAGYATSRTPDISALVGAGYATYGLHPGGGHRANITRSGRDALASI